MFDIQFTIDYAKELGFEVVDSSESLVVIDLGFELKICFENIESDNDTSIYFLGSNGGWHSHGDLFADGNDDIAMVPVSLLQSILNGNYLISKTVYPNEIVNIALEYANSKYDLTLLDPGETLTFYKIPNRA